MDVSEWQKRLSDNFSENDIVGYKLLKIIEQENLCGQHFVKSYIGQDILMHSFQNFFIETLERSFNWVSKNGWPQKSESYAPIMIYFLIMFRRLRACENLMLKGYPLDGYALLRDLKDRAILLAGIAHNMTTLSKILYSKDFTSHEGWIKSKRDRKNEEFRIRNRILGKESGLPIEIIRELGRWEQLFNEEVHGSKFSLFFELGDLLKNRNIPTIGPESNKYIAMYMNRVCEISWIILHLLQYLQPNRDAFDSEWQHKKTY